MIGKRQSKPQRQRERYEGGAPVEGSYAPLLPGGEWPQEQDGQDTLGRSTRISVAPAGANVRSATQGRWGDAAAREDETGEALTLGFAAGRAAAASLKKALAERSSMLRGSFAERSESMGKSKAQKIAKSSSGTGRASAGPGQMTLRQRDKFVPLPDSLIGDDDDDGTSPVQHDLGMDPMGETSSAPPGVFASFVASELDLPPPGPDDSHFPEQPASPRASADPRQTSSPRATARGLGQDSASRGRITVYCMADALDRAILTDYLKAHYKPESIHPYIDVMHLRIDEAQKNPVPDAFFFDYGVIIVWGLDEHDEKALVKRIGQVCEVGPYQPQEVEIDEFQFNYSANEPPHIQNDMITINKRQASDHQVRLAISHALAQSIKLSIYEAEVMELVEETRDLPESLAKYGKVNISSKKVAMLIGKVFLQSSTVNLLSSVLDTPEYFWYAPDSLQALYERACEYLELETRVEVLNARFQVLQEMLDMLRDHKNNAHASRLEWIIIWLLVVDVFLMIFQLLGLFGFV